METIMTISVNSLAPAHLDVFVRALTNLLSTNRAEFVFAQIVDGLPAHDTVGHQPSLNNEIRNNAAPSQEAVNAVKQYRGTIDVMSMQLDVKKVQRYQDTTPGSTEFNLRLLELLAVTCHDIAAFLYTTTRPGIRQEVQDPEKQAVLLEGRETNFMLGEYPDWQQYPKGVADMVGYWAEYHLFGGVVLFDRGNSGTDCNAVFLHPVSDFMIFQLSDNQIHQIIEFVNQDPNSNNTIPPPFPFKGERWERRVDPFDAMRLNIFRDKYERIIPRERPRRCVRRAEDDPHYPDHVAFLEELHRERDAAKNTES